MAGVIVVGAGGMGRETAAWLEAAGRGADLIGFLDDDAALHGTQVVGRAVLGEVGWLADHPDVEAVVAIGSPTRRAAVVDVLDGLDVALATVVHPTATIGPGVTIGAGAVVSPAVVLTCDVEIGRAAILNYGAMVGHDGRVGDTTFLGPGACLGGNVTVGSGAEVGIGASVIQGITVGERSVVGAGAVVVRDVAADTTVAGVPARPLVEQRS